MKKAKATFTATFADGMTVNRTSTHDYTVAWRAGWRDKDGTFRWSTGFAVNQDRASPWCPAYYCVHAGLSANERARNKRMNEALRVERGYTVEFTPAVRL